VGDWGNFHHLLTTALHRPGTGILGLFVFIFVFVSWLLAQSDV
jgi:hypothetical protein